MQGKLIDLQFSLDGKQRLTIELLSDFRKQFDDLRQFDVDVDVKKHRNKRSRDANAYAWCLIDQIAAVTGQTKTEIYRNAIRDIGGVSEIVCVRNKSKDTLMQVWSQRGLGWQVEELDSKLTDCTNLVLYYGSSTYDTRQMSALIDSLVQDARAIGIETRPQEEIDSLIRSFNHA